MGLISRVSSRTYRDSRMSTIFKLLISSSRRQQKNCTRLLHANLIKYSQRQFIPTKITKITDKGSEKTPVKLFQLRPEQPISYIPGQWIDLQPDDSSIRLVGLSLTNYDQQSPEVAVKISPHPAVQWLHKRAGINSKVEIAVGEDVSFAMSEEHLEQSTHILLIAGGIGITPCMSMLDYLSKRSSETPETPKISLINLQKCEANDVFKDRLLNLKKSLNFSCHTLYSRNEVSSEIPKILDALTDKNGIRCYLCGPPGMMQKLIDLLNERQI